MCGVKLGEHSRDVESLTGEIKERVIDAGCNFVYIRTKHREKLPQEVFFNWANIPVLEVMNGNPDELVPFCRGAARAYNRDKWGALIAHEWYGGIRHSDILKRKRLQLAYKYAYLSGADIILMESGDEKINSYGEKHDYDSELCQEYRKVLKETCDYAKSDKRPSGGPLVNFAFVSGRYDAWGGFCGSSLWDQFERKEWATMTLNIHGKLQTNLV